MLDLFRRHHRQQPSGPDDPSGGGQRSKVFPKFLKRLAGRDRPSVLDLGRLSGGNIEIFARLGCRVQIEDLVHASEEATGGGSRPGEATPSSPPAASVTAAPAGAAASPPAGSDAAAEPSAPTSLPPVAESTAPPGQAAGPAAPPAGGPGPAPGTGRKPARHIVLPPRTFARAPSSSAAGRAASTPPRTPLATHLEYQDASFDAIVAWDLFSYYDPASARTVAAEVARVLKPGGLVFAYFHTRAAQTPDGPLRYRIVDESCIEAGPPAGGPIARHVHQNRDIEKMFTGLRIAESCFLKSGVREMVLEKRAPASAPPAGTPVARPRPRFRID
jgi:SAM-dependent methyltransferase